MTITSQDNPAIKELRRLATAHGRSRSEVFAAEGEDLVAAASRAGWQAERVLVREGSGLDGEEVSAELLDSVSTLGSGTRIIATFRRKWSSDPTAGLIVHLAGLRDPGNVGTIVRSADALGATTVSIGAATADPFGPKAVRASMGSVFRVPLVKDIAPLELPGLRIGLVAGGGSSDLPDGNIVLVVGSEREGIAGDLIAACDRTWSIPMVEGVDSLNAAVACSLALHAANRIPS